MSRVVFIFVFLLSFNSQSFAWGKRGHEIVASVAARLLEEKEQKHFLRSHEFDLGYYANVPDIIWRNLGKEIGREEGPEHYIDWGSDFKNVFGSPENLPVKFSEFKAKMGSHFKVSEGMAPYRIHGFVERCKKITQDLTFKTQGPLLVCIGVLSHYTGDLSMPLHTSDNHDGEQTHQKGVHSYFENTLVNALDPELKPEVLEKALALYQSHPAKNMTSDQAVRWLISESQGQVEPLLTLDREGERKDIPHSKTKFKEMIVDQLAQGAVITALVWKDILRDVHEFDENKFYYFDGTPDYVEPGKE